MTLSARTWLFVGSFALWGCITDGSAVESFSECLTKEELKAYNGLEAFCDEFLEENYPGSRGYVRFKRFYTDLYGEERDRRWKIDTAGVYLMAKKLAGVFGDTYDIDRAEFLPLCNISACLAESSNSRWLNKFTRGKQTMGSSGPHLVANQLLYSDHNPESGLYKKVLVTEVIWRILYYQVTVNNQKY